MVIYGVDDDHGNGDGYNNDDQPSVSCLNQRTLGGGKARILQERLVLVVENRLYLYLYFYLDLWSLKIVCIFIFTFILICSFIFTKICIQICVKIHLYL